MRLSDRDNVLIMSAIYSESLTHSVFSSPHPSVSRTVCHVTRVTVCSVVESFISAWQPWDSWTPVSAGLSAGHHRIAVGVWGGWLLTERIWWAGKDIHSTKALKSLFWVDANPLTFNNSSFWQQRASSGRVSGWACWARQAMAGICLSEWVSREPIWMAERLTSVKRDSLSLSFEKRNLKLIDKWAISHVWQEVSVWTKSG